MEATMQINRKKAQVLSLHHDECTIINALLDASDKKQFTILNLARATGIPRTSLYYMLTKLKKRGFVHSKKILKRVYWENTELVRTHLCDDAQTHNSIQTYSPSSTTSIEILFGPDMIKVFSDLSKLPIHSRYYGIQPEKSLISAIKNADNAKINILNDLIKQKKHIVEAVLNERSIETMKKEFPASRLKPIFKSLHGRTADTAKLPDDYMADIDAEIYIYNNTVSIMNWDSGYAVTIRDKHFYKLILEMFKSTKYMLKKYDQNEKLAQVLVDLGE